MSDPLGRSLRDRFDIAPVPDADGLAETHDRDLYLATDGSYDPDTIRAGLGAIVERGDGECIARLAARYPAPDNNAAEYHALISGFRLLQTVASPGDRIGVLVDHDDLASNLNRFVRFVRDPACHDPGTERIPSALRGQWQGLGSFIGSAADLRAAVIPGQDNPAHPLASQPERYVSVPGVTTEVPSAPSRPRYLRSDMGAAQVDRPADD